MCSELFHQAELLLLQAEEHIALLDSFAPLNFESEKRRIERLLAHGAVSLPRYEYRRERLRALQLASRQISSAEELLTQGGASGLLLEIFLERSKELEVEVRLVAARDTEQVVCLSRERYLFSDAELARGAELAELWLQEAADASIPESARPGGEVKLASYLVQKSRLAGYSFRVLERSMPSIAAVGGDCLFVRKGALVEKEEAERIWVHEVGAHLLPRLQAKRSGPPFCVGTASANEDEEGRAILLEERAGLLGRERKLELALRFVLASAARLSLPRLSSLALRLVQEGASSAQVADAVCRVSRGGGLAREVSYLASFVRVKDALESEPELEAWMERGRVSVDAARRLQREFASERS